MREMSEVNTAREKNEMISHVVSFGRYGHIDFQRGPVPDGVNGTTLEEVLEKLIAFMENLGNVVPSRETSLVITKLEEALLWQKRRTEKRVARNVEGTYQR